MATIRVLLLGDIIGVAGRMMFQKHSDRLRKQYACDAVIVNGENSADGRGITPRIARFFKHNGVDVITTGNHIWHRREMYAYLNEYQDVLRPANYPSEAPGVGVTTFTCKGYTIGVINLQGRIFMRENLDCPFKTVDSILTYLKNKTKIVFVDFHAEATAEKMGLGFYLDGRISALVGTHTHIQTADERVLPGGTAYISDLGMAGSLNSMIGMKKEPVIEHMITQLPTRFVVDTSSPVILTGAVVAVDADTGKAISIERVRVVDEDLRVTDDDLDSKR